MHGVRRIDRTGALIEEWAKAGVAIPSGDRTGDQVQLAANIDCVADVRGKSEARESGEKPLLHLAERVFIEQPDIPAGFRRVSATERGAPPAFGSPKKPDPTQTQSDRSEERRVGKE